MIPFNVKKVPFSAGGSWMAFSILDECWAPDGIVALYMRSHHDKFQNLFRIIPLADGRKADCRLNATPSCLQIMGPDESLIDIVFDGTRTVRIRGKGMALRLEAIPKSLVYSQCPGQVTFNMRPALRRYALQSIRGSMQIDDGTDGAAGACFSAEDNDGEWEIAIDEFWSTWEPRDRSPFDTVRTQTADAFQQFLDSLPPGPEEFAATRELAGYVNWSAIVEPCGLIKRPAMLMSKNWMCNVWSWDHCFNAMALAAGNPKLSLDQFMVVADHQDEFGCFPDAINDTHIHYNFCKPPVHGWTISELLHRFKQPVNNDTLQTLYRILCAQTEWWLTHRRIKGQELPFYLNGNDSGWDNSTMFDSGVPLISPDLSALLVMQMDVLSDLAAQLDRPDERITWKEKADRLLQALTSELWRGDHFTARLADGTDVPSQSLIPNVSILLGKRLPEEIQNALCASIQTFLTDWGLATEHIESDKYESDGYWRGSIWAPPTYMIVSGLEACGHIDLAIEISERFCRLCATSGFAENFNALTGAPQWDPAYTWTSSVFLLLAEKLSTTYRKETP